jgi:hypothetical protein
VAGVARRQHARTHFDFASISGRLPEQLRAEPVEVPEGDARSSLFRLKEFQNRPMPL